MNWIEQDYRFPKADPEAETYFEDFGDNEELIYAYSFSSIPQMKALLKERTNGALSDQEILESVKDAFRCAPKKKSETILPEDRQIVDFIYQF